MGERKLSILGISVKVGLRAKKNGSPKEAAFFLDLV